MPQIFAIPAFDDNYIWCLHDGRNALVVDPGDAAPVQSALSERGVALAAIVVTHHHFDHVGGIESLLAQSPVPVYGPAGSSPHIDRPMANGDSPVLLGTVFEVLAVPGHTLDHIAYYATDVDGSPVLFCGDTLFAGGCGRLFEGSAEQMYASLNRLSELPAQTRVYCAHEYTAANLRFALAVEPGNAALQQRSQQVQRLRERGEPTVPSNLSEELATNPFLRCCEPAVREAVAAYASIEPASAVETFAAVRRWKDSF